MKYAAKTLAGAVLSLGLLLAAPAARAQDVGPVFDMGQLTGSLSIPTTVKGKSGKSPAVTRPATSNVNLSYTPSAALRQQTLQTLNQQMQATDPAGAKVVAASFAPGKPDYDQLFANLVKDSGLPVNNTATAMTAYFEMGYAIVNDIQTPQITTPAQDRALYRELSGILSQNTTLKSPAAVAKLGEQLKLKTVVLAMGWQGARKDGKLSEFRNGVAEQFKKSGLDMSQMRITEQGLVKK